MRYLWMLIAVLALLGATACWVPVQISAPSDNTVYILDHQLGGAPEGRVIRCTGTSCVKIYHPQ